VEGGRREEGGAGERTTSSVVHGHVPTTSLGVMRFHCSVHALPQQTRFPTAVSERARSGKPASLSGAKRLPVPFGSSPASYHAPRQKMDPTRPCLIESVFSQTRWKSWRYDYVSQPPSAPFLLVFLSSRAGSMCDKDRRRWTPLCSNWCG